MTLIKVPHARMRIYEKMSGACAEGEDSPPAKLQKLDEASNTSPLSSDGAKVNGENDVSKQAATMCTFVVSIGLCCIRVPGP